MPKVDFTAIQLGQLVSRSVIRGGSMVRKTKHKVINFSDKFFVIDTHEKITYDGKRYPSIRAVGEAPVKYDFWRENEREFYASDVVHEAERQITHLLEKLQTMFPEASEKLLKETIKISLSSK